MKPEVSSLCSQEPVICLYPEPDESLPNPPILFLFKNHFSIILTKTLRCSKWPLSFRCNPPPPNPVRPTHVIGPNPFILHSLITTVLVLFLSIGDLQAYHQQTRTPNTHRWHTHAATYYVIIQTQRTHISGRNSNGTKHSGGAPEDGREKGSKHVGVLYLQTRF
jgi:hypothetical protein